MKSLISIANQDILNSIHKWQTGGSPWSVKAVHSHKLNVNKYRPLKGGSYLPLPEKVQNSIKGLINMKNLNDDECFWWCHLAFKFPAKKKPQRITKYKEHIDKLDYSGDSFTVKMKDVPRIERQNNVAINVFLWTGVNAIPHRLT